MHELRRTIEHSNFIGPQIVGDPETVAHEPFDRRSNLPIFLEHFLELCPTDAVNSRQRNRVATG
jgi:hypothetical protein